MNFLNRKIDHINLSVPDMEKSLKFYTEMMNFKIVNRFKNNMEFVFITDGNLIYELIEKKELKKTVIDHIAYTSTDIFSDFEYFKNKELTISEEVGYIDYLFENGMYYFFIESENKDRIEFCQKKEK